MSFNNDEVDYLIEVLRFKNDMCKHELSNILDDDYELDELNDILDYYQNDLCLTQNVLSKLYQLKGVNS